jgi:DNA-directed RNA polymerase subunit K/omega
MAVHPNETAFTITIWGPFEYNSPSFKPIGLGVDMTDEKKITTIVDPFENRYISVLASSKRARQLLDRAEKHNLTVDTEKVILQALNEFLSGKVSPVTGEEAPTGKKKKKEE